MGNIDEKILEIFKQLEIKKQNINDGQVKIGNRYMSLRKDHFIMIIVNSLT